MRIRRGYTFDDLLLVPKRSSITKRENVDLSVKWNNIIKTKLPVVSANMKHVTDYKMAAVIAESGGMALLHRFASNDERIQTFLNLVKYNCNIGMSFGATENEVYFYKEFVKEYGQYLKIACIDIAHGHSDICINAIKAFKDLQPDSLLIAGNVATSEGAYDLWKAGADVIKVGIGSGCLAAGTKVLMADGTTKPIESIKIGDYVMNYKYLPVRVTNVFSTGIKKVVSFENENGKSFITEDHLIYLQAKEKYMWKPISFNLWGTSKSIKRYGLMPRQRGYYNVPTIVTGTDKEMEVFDITVDCPSHSFVANGIVVHNSICSTRIETGNGVPQLSALEEVWSYFKPFGNKRPLIISDGGLSKVGNIVKALCFSDAVMLGNMLAGTDESPGELISKDGLKFKAYAGSSTFKQNNVEGYSGLVPYRGPVGNILKRIREGVQSGCSYQGVNNLTDLKIDPEFVKITGAGNIESGAHDLIL